MVKAPTKKKVLAKMAEIERRVEAGAALQIDVVMPPGQRAKVGWARALKAIVAPDPLCGLLIPRRTSTCPSLVATLCLMTSEYNESTS